MCRNNHQHDCGHLTKEEDSTKCFSAGRPPTLRPPQPVAEMPDSWMLATSATGTETETWKGVSVISPFAQFRSNLMRFSELTCVENSDELRNCCPVSPLLQQQAVAVGPFRCFLHPWCEISPYFPLKNYLSISLHGHMKTSSMAPWQHGQLLSRRTWELRPLSHLSSQVNGNYRTTNATLSRECVTCKSNGHNRKEKFCFRTSSTTGEYFSFIFFAVFIHTRWHWIGPESAWNRTLFKADDFAEYFSFSFFLDTCIGQQLTWASSPSVLSTFWLWFFFFFYISKSALSLVFTEPILFWIKWRHVARKETHPQPTYVSVTTVYMFSIYSLN